MQNEGKKEIENNIDDKQITNHGKNNLQSIGTHLELISVGENQSATKMARDLTKCLRYASNSH